MDIYWRVQSGVISYLELAIFSKNQNTLVHFLAD